MNTIKSRDVFIKIHNGVCMFAPSGSPCKNMAVHKVFLTYKSGEHAWMWVCESCIEEAVLWWDKMELGWDL